MSENNQLIILVSEIRRLHDLAETSAKDAVRYAMEAGKLLLQAKSNLPHGEFQKWVKEHLGLPPRRAQRYLQAARGETPKKRLTESKSDTVSHLSKAITKSIGIWNGDNWTPEPGWSYMFEEDGSYWVTPAKNGGYHISRLYSGEALSSVDRYWRYTILAKTTDPEIEDPNYIGTRFAPLNPNCVAEIMRSFGLKDLRSSKLTSIKFNTILERPIGEPDSSCWYWDDTEPNDGLFQTLKSSGMVNNNGVATLV